MYKIMKNGKRFNNKTFSTYEEARKYALKKVRASDSVPFKFSFESQYPTLSDCNFSIKRIEV